MAIDLNTPAPGEEDGEEFHHFTAALGALHPASGWQEDELGDAEHDAGGSQVFDLNLDPYKSDEDDNVYADHVDVVFDWEQLSESTKVFDLNLDPYESDEDGNVYADHVDVIFDWKQLSESNHEGDDGPVIQQGNAGIVRKRKNLTKCEKHTIYEALLQRSNTGKLKRITTTLLAGLFNVNRKQVSSIWKIAKNCIAAGQPVDFSSNRAKSCGRMHQVIDLARVAALPLDKRTTIRSLAEELQVKRSTLHRLFKQGKLRRHSNTLKPYLKDENKKHRLQFAASMLDAQTVATEPTFIDMKNIIHIDEKWFNATKKSKNFYMLPDEDDPLRSVQNKNSIPKYMLLAAIGEPRYDSQGICYFNGKIGIWPFVRKEPAQRASRNRPRGTLITKCINVTRNVSRSYLISKVIPAIKVCWPREDAGKTIWIQQDNARTHVSPDDSEFLLAVAQSGLDIHLMNQPPNSPDMNVLDLGFFASLQSKTYLRSARNIDQVISNVEQEFSRYDVSLIRKVFLTLQGCMIEVTKLAGGNGYKIPHMNKDGLKRGDMLPSNLTVDKYLYDSVIQELTE